MAKDASIPIADIFLADSTNFSDYRCLSKSSLLLSNVKLPTGNSTATKFICCLSQQFIWDHCIPASGTVLKMKTRNFRRFTWYNLWNVLLLKNLNKTFSKRYYHLSYTGYSWQSVAYSYDISKVEWSWTLCKLNNPISYNLR
jgi:hypothetical protein